MEREIYLPSREIVHLDDFDVMINHRQTSVSEDELLGLLQSLISSAKLRFGRGPLDEWKNFSSKGMVDRSEDPLYYAKTKWIHGAHPFFLLAKTTSWNADENSLYRKKEAYAGVSLLNEMALSGVVKEVVSSDKVQAIFRDLGAESIDYVEPLIGIINKEKKRKIMVYKFVQGINFGNVYLGSLQSERNAIEKLKEAFRERGIEPDDLHASQILVEKDERGKNRFHLIDSEFYFRI